MLFQKLIPFVLQLEEKLLHNSVFSDLEFKENTATKFLKIIAIGCLFRQDWSVHFKGFQNLIKEIGNFHHGYG